LGKAAYGRPFSFIQERAMQPDKTMPAVTKPPASDKDGKTIQAEAQSDTEPFDAGKGSAPELRKAAEDLKTKIAEAKRRNDMPVDSALGNPGWERNAADGHLDIPDKEDDE
jgi:hypothetical protein